MDNRLVEIADKLSAQPTAPINQACDDWADTKAAYRLFDNDKVTPEKILGPHQTRTSERMADYPVILAVQDTTILNYTHHPQTAGLGPIGTTAQDLQGLVMHTTLILTPEGLPLGVLTQDIWARPDNEEKLSRKERSERPIEEKESYKWLRALQKTVELAPQGVQVVTICDRESDVYEFFVEAANLNVPILARAAQNRSLMDEEAEKLWEQVAVQPIAGHLKIQVPSRDTEPAREAIVAIRFCSVTLKPPWRPRLPDHDPLPPITLDAILVQEIDPPANVTPLEWRLLTSVPVHSFEDAVERVRWYRCRWHIEVYHKVLKSGCKVEDCRLETAERLIRFLTLSSIIAWRLYWLTLINRHRPEDPCTAILAEHEWQALYATINRTTLIPQQPPTVRLTVRWIAQLGGFLGRKSDGEPGITVIWRGWQRLNDISTTWLILHPTPT